LEGKVLKHHEMNDPARSNVIAYCIERHRLLSEFTEAVQCVGLLHDQQVAALLNGDEDFTRFELQLHIANEKKNRGKYAYMSHVEAHGCGVAKEVQAA
jgi:hypothetical protein